MKRKLFVISITAVAVLSLVGGGFALNGYFGGGADIPEDATTRGLVGYWAFEDGTGTTANDASDSNNDGTLTNAPTWTSGKAGNGGALDFDGTNDWVSIADADSLSFGDGASTDTPFTIAFWIYPRDTTFETIFDKRTSASSLEYSLFFQADETFLLRLFDLNNSNLIDRVSGTAISLNNWHHIAVTYDASGSGSGINWYVDGILDNGSAGSSGTYVAMHNTTAVLEITDTDDPFDGQLDEVRVYNRALSAAEVRYLYNRGGPVGHWKFDEGSGTTAFDSANNAGDGTITGATYATGQYGTALDFERGNSDRVVVSDNASLAGSTQTISYWVNVESHNGLDQAEVVSKWNAATQRKFLAGFDTDGSYYFFWRSTDCDTGGVSDPFTTVASTGSWIHVAFVVDDTGNTVDLYENGVNIESASFTGDLCSDVTTDLYIGARGTPDEFFDGLIDDVRIYNYARTAGEIRLDYNAGFAAKFGGSPNQDVTRGLVGYWDFEDGTGTTANDASDSNNDGTLTNGPVWTSGKAGNGGALDFDGTNDYVSLPSSASLNIDTSSSDVTVAMWIRRTASAPLRAGLVCFGDTNSSYWCASLGDADSGTNSFTYYIDGSSSSGSHGNTTIPQDEWHFVAFTRTTNGTVNHYYDGVADGSSTGTTNSTATGNRSIGARLDGPTYFPGLLDEIRVYNRALSAAEIRYLYNRGGPIAHWKFDEGSGTTAFDSANNAGDGTITGATYATGQFGTALDFDGTDDNVNVADTSVLDYADTDDMTISGWFNRDTASTDDVLVAKRNSFDTASDVGYIAYLDATGDNLIFEVSDGTDEYTLTSSASFISTGWNHFAIVWDEDSAPSSEIYINGKADSATDTGTIGNIGSLSNAVALRIATESDGGSPFDGKLDDVRIYKYARTAAEIRADYNAGFAARFGPSTGSGQAAPNQDVTRGLVGYWAFEDGTGTTANDSSDSNNDGTLTNAPTWTSGKAGNGGALDFDGSDDFVLVDSGVVTAAPFTACLWFNVADADNSYTLLFVGDKNSANQRWRIVARGNVVGDPVRFAIEAGAGTTNVDTTTGFQANTWHFACAVERSSTDRSVYIDAGSEATNTTSVAPSGANTVNIGRDGSSSPGNYTSGQIDEVRVYNRALSAAEVRYLYNRGGPVGHWKFDDGSGSTAFDASNITGDGTITGATWVQGQFGTALDLDGSDDVVTVTNANPIDFDIGLKNAVAFSAWINADTAGEGTGGQVFWKGTNTWLRVDTLSGGKLDLEASLDLATTDATLNVSAAITQNAWHHVAMVYEDDADDEISLYVDGKLVGTSTDGSGAPAGTDTNNLLIAGTTTNNFDGTIDDFRVYQYARSANEILADYNAGLSTHFR